MRELVNLLADLVDEGAFWARRLRYRMVDASVAVSTSVRHYCGRVYERVVKEIEEWKV